MNYLDKLEAEAIYILREVIAEFEKPVLMYSIGKDSSVLLYLLQKAIWPAKLSIPLLHVDTNWKFREMIDFRNKIKDRFNLLVHSNLDYKEYSNPFINAKEHTYQMKTVALKQVLDKYKFDAIIGGARRDEEKSRAKERVFSFRNKNHQWIPENQRPELWNLYNSKISQHESVRIFPLSNWTEINIWQYIEREHIDVVPLYFAKERLVSHFDDSIILLDDDRVPKEIKDIAQLKVVRFRTLGCYPLTGAMESNARTPLEIIAELYRSNTREREGRSIDQDEDFAMEMKKREGYF